MRCSHPPSHSTAEARDQRSQWQNRQAAFRRCVEQESFQKWLKRRTSGAVASLEELERQIGLAVERAMASENILVEAWDGETWRAEDCRARQSGDPRPTRPERSRIDAELG